MKSAIVIDDTLATGLLANATACIATGLFKDEPDAYGAAIKGADHTFIPITKIPILILKQGKRSFQELLQRAESAHLKVMIFTHEGQSTASYDEYIERVHAKPTNELTIVGIGILGEDKAVNTVAGDLPLLR